ncbi:MAG TPA: 1-(5-phosphoribosyl)-5-[(5-phosphoribosylamino)methylideneamino]imidazole-4-carboxamide isomerase [Planctomycetaceae bacterium]|nr:1-(5-phosphoribosyl)-5-[(5-phosphoribosylamino)methylideneamino]imidazole-4-carboxamide isomerase [Planctomycetaceae bacterium]
MEILPAIDIRNGKCVRLVQGDYGREVVFGDDPVEMAGRWAAEGASRLHLVDLDGARAGRPVNDPVIRRIVQAVTIPCQCGGGLRDDDSLERLLDDIGVGRVIVGTQALRQPEWFREAVARYPERIVLGLDARESKIATGGWLDTSEVPALDLARRYADLPLAAIVYTNIANDGMLQGIDRRTLDDLAELADLGVPVIASGGVTTLDDVRNLIGVACDHPRLEGAIIGRALYEGTIRLADAIRTTGS